jgi:hypothetical protein
VALTWDISECPDWINTKDERGVTDALIWYSVPLGYGQITERNADEVYAAIHVYEALTGNTLLVAADGSPRPITPYDVQGRIGLKTNAVNGKSPAANITRIVKRRLADSRAEYVRALEVIL